MSRSNLIDPPRHSEQYADPESEAPTTPTLSMTTADGTVVTIDDVVNQVRFIDSILSQVLVKGTDYDVITGCGDKPTLLQPGAQVLLRAFKIGYHHELVRDYDPATEIVTYTCTISGTDASGRVIGTGLGICSSGEDKYRWRRAASDAEFQAAPDDRRRIKYYTNSSDQMVVNNFRNVENTVAKMAYKRALVSLALNATAASRKFTQDLDDLGPNFDGEVGRQSATNASTREKPTSSPHVATVVKIDPFTRGGHNGWDVTTDDGYVFGTFDEDLAGAARRALEAAEPAKILWKTHSGGKYLNLVGVRKINGNNGDDDSGNGRVLDQLHDGH